MSFARSHCPRTSFKPMVCVLEDRTVPSGFRIFGPPPPGPITHFVVEALTNVQTGTAFNLVVIAEDAHNHVATSYRGTVTFSLGVTDNGATLPAQYTFTAADKGQHSFQVTLLAGGGETIKVADAKKTKLAGHTSVTVLPPVPTTPTQSPSSPSSFSIGPDGYAVLGTPMMPYYPPYYGMSGYYVTPAFNPYFNVAYNSGLSPTTLGNSAFPYVTWGTY